MTKSIKDSDSMDFDVIIVGSGVSGSFIANDLSNSGYRSLILEAGDSFDKFSYPDKEIDANSKLYWNGGIELNKSADIGLLRPKCVGGGSVVNQALLDRFDDIALDSWKNESGIDFFSRSSLDPYYDKAESELEIETIDEKFRNGNAKIFEKGFKSNGYQAASLRRGQKNCDYESGNDCIECLSGCKRDSKQSTPVTTLFKSLKKGSALITGFEVQLLYQIKDGVLLSGKDSNGVQRTFRSKACVLAAGAIGNTKILLKSGYRTDLGNLGEYFYTHPQFMNIALYDEVINAHKGPFQSMKSDDANFRNQGFKLENVFAPPVGLAMLLPQTGKKLHKIMKKMNHFACIEVAIRDTNPGRITLSDSGSLRIEKTLNSEDLKRKETGLKAMNNVFKSTGAREIFSGSLAIGLHLMGGCRIGNSKSNSVVNPEFNLHGSKDIFVADSSIFPNAPGINPSLTIMALSLMASENIKGRLRG